MDQRTRDHQPRNVKLILILGTLIVIGLIVGAQILAEPFDGPAGTQEQNTAQAASTALAAEPTAIATLQPTSTPSPSATVTPIPSNTPTPTVTPTLTPTPTPTLDLMSCNAAGCGPNADPLPTVTYVSRLLLTTELPQRRFCPECPKNEFLSEQELDRLVAADPATLQQLSLVALSQAPYQIAPGIVYIVSDYVHHVVVDLKESGFIFRNIVPPVPDEETRETIRITPSYCLWPDSLVVTTADYHGLVGSNKTEEGRELFFHLGRAALFEREDEFDIDVIREHPDFAATSVSWGGGPIFMWDGKYDFNPEQEWFTPENLEHYRTSRWAKLTVTVSEDRKYLFISSSFGLTLQEHAENIITLAEKWGIKADRAMRFDGSESTYIAIRMGEFMVPLLSLEEPLIVNCFAIEQE